MFLLPLYSQKLTATTSSVFWWVRTEISEHKSHHHPLNSLKLFLPHIHLYSFWQGEFIFKPSRHPLNSLKLLFPHNRRYMRDVTVVTPTEWQTDGAEWQTDGAEWQRWFKYRLNWRLAKPSHKLKNNITNWGRAGVRQIVRTGLKSSLRKASL